VAATDDLTAELIKFNAFLAVEDDRERQVRAERKAGKDREAAAAHLKKVMGDSGASKDDKDAAEEAWKAAVATEERVKAGEPAVAPEPVEAAAEPEAAPEAEPVEAAAEPEAAPEAEPVEAAAEPEAAPEVEPVAAEPDEADEVEVEAPAAPSPPTEPAE
jgi:ribonuclease E